MAKVRGPLLSFGASGQIGKAAVFGSWRGIAYAREYTTPANPQTVEQTLTRNVFSFIQSVWKQAPALFQAPWTLYAQGKPLTNRNVFSKFNVGILRGAPDLDDFVFSPGALGGLPPASMVITPGNDQLSVAVTPPAVLPVGWTIASAIVAAIEEQDPETGTEYQITAGEDVSDPYTVVLALQNATQYEVGAWLKWNRPQGDFAYSPAIRGTGLTT